MIKNKLRKYTAEAFGTFCLVLLGTGAIATNDWAPGLIGHIGISAAFGLIVLVMIYSIGHISGAHMNPAVTIGFLATKKIKSKEALFYIISQMIGATLASLSLRLIFLHEAVNLGLTQPQGSLTQSLFIEFLFTFILMFVIKSVATDDRAEGSMAGIAIGSCVMIIALIGGPISGGSVNPARSFAPALITFNFSAQWIYWLAPIAGSILGALTYKAIKCEDDIQEGSHGCC